MESHTDTATVEAPAESDNPIDSLPQETTQDSFLDALDAALDNINNPEFVESVDQEAQEVVEKEEQKTEEATEESTEETVEETSEEKTEEGSDKEVEDNKEKINSDDPIEELSDEVGDEWTPKAANRFKQLKEELRTNKSELDTLRQTVKEQESKMSELTAIAENKDVEALQEQLRQYEIEKSFSYLENTYQYKEVVTEPLNRLMDRAEVIAEKYEVDYDALVDIISMDDSTKQDQALSELLPEASGRDKSTIYRVIEDIDPIIQKRNELFENADEALQEAQYIQEQKAQMELAEKAEVRNVITKNVVQRVSEKLPFLSGVEG